MARARRKEWLHAVWDGRKFGFINRRGRMIIQPQYDGAAGGFDDWTCVDVADREGFIDAEGNWLIKPAYDLACPPSEGLAAVERAGKWGYVDRRGHVVISLRFDHAGDFREGLAPAMVGRKWGYLDRRGRPVSGFRYRHACEFHEGLGRVSTAKGYAFVDREMRTVIGPLRFEVFVCFSQHRVPFWRDRKRGYLDHRAEEVIPPIFQAGHPFSQGLAWVRLGRLWGCIRRDGSFAISPRFPGWRLGGRGPMRGPYGFSEGLSAVRVKGRFGYVDRSGDWVIEPRFHWARGFQQGLADVSFRKGRRFVPACINRRGRVVWPRELADR